MTKHMALDDVNSPTIPVDDRVPSFGFDWAKRRGLLESATRDSMPEVADTSLFVEG